MRVCVCTVCVCVCKVERAGKREYVLSIHNEKEFCGKNMEIISCFFLFFTIFICLVRVNVGFGYFACKL